MKFLVPKFYKDFTCTGSECEYTCCQKWGIMVDKKTYKKYKKYKGDKHIEKLFQENIKRNRKSNYEGDYAKIVLNEDKMCPFLNSDNLCSIYIKCGEDFMCKVCKVYPRIHSEMKDFVEKGLSLSCPEVLKVGILNKDKIEFDIIESNLEPDTIYNFSYNKFTKKEMDVFWIIRTFSIGLIQNRNYKLDERLSILAISMNNINKLLEDNKYSEIESKLNFYQKLIDNNEFKDIISKLNVDNEFQMKFFNAISKLGYRIDGRNKDYSDIYMKSLKNINYNEDGIENSNYNTFYKKYTDNMTEKSYILEHFFVLNMYNSKFPYSLKNGVDIMDNLFALIFKYVILKFNLLASADEYDENSFEEIALKIIYIMSRFMNHNPGYIKGMLDWLDNHDMKTLEHMLALIIE